MDKDVYKQMKVHFGVVLSYAVADPLTVMIHPIYAFSAPSTVVVPIWFDCLAYLAFLLLYLFTTLLLFSYFLLLL